MADLHPGLVPKTLGERDARGYLGCSEDKFRQWKKEGLIAPLEGNLYLVSELDALIDKLKKRREDAARKDKERDEQTDGVLRPQEKPMGSKPPRGTPKRSGMARALLG